MNSRHILFIFAAVFLAAPTSASALVLSEVMYDLEAGSDSGREWVEVFNDSATSVTLTEWKFYESSSNHSIAVHTGGETLTSGSYAIIAVDPAKFLEDWPTFDGMLFDSAFSLSNSGETLVLRCCLTGQGSSDLSDRDSYTYTSTDGAAGDGESLQKDSSGWSAAAPTPGTGSLDADEEEDEEETTTASSSTQTSTPTTPISSYVAPPVPVLFADAGEDRTVIVGADTEFRGRAYNRAQEDVTERVRFSWNFGDGSTAEGQAVLHHFSYPGKYAVVLDVAQDYNAVSNRIVLSAVPADISFVVNGDGSISIKNNAGRDIDISRWRVASFNQFFTFPEGTTILAGAEVRVAQATLRFYATSAASELQYPNATLAYKAGVVQHLAADPQPKVEETPARVAPPQPQLPAPEIHLSAASAAETTEEVPTTSLQVAAAASAESGGTLWWLGAGALAALIALVAVYVRRLQRGEWHIIEQ